MTRHGPRGARLAGLLLVAAVLATGCTDDSAGRPAPGTGTGTPNPTAPRSGPPPEAPGARMTEGWPAGLPSVEPVVCPAPTVRVATADELHAALEAAEPGDVVGLADGDYEGEFALTASGSADAPVWVCGGAGARLKGAGPEGDYVLHLEGVEHVRLVGFSVQEGQKGVMVDGSNSVVIQGLTVSQIGDEAIHLRGNSTGNVVSDSRISDTGLRRAKFGEGVYVGTAESNWCDITGCEPDRSDRNVVVGNTIVDVTAEAVDVKEGTTGGVVAQNTFDGAGMSEEVDSWVDVKGNDWLIQGNVGTTSRYSGFQTHEVVDGWGTDNLFDANVAEVAGPGFGFELRPVRGNRVTCSNEVIDAGQGLSNVDCT